MERQIKFRAFVYSTPSGICPKRMDYIDNKILFDWEDEGVGMHIMQFTGLTDCNGKEIWEGDYLDGAGVVQWDDNNACYITSLGGNTLALSNSHREVIGNIHESPELLKTT